MTAYEITQDLLDATTGANVSPGRRDGSPLRARRSRAASGRLRAAVTGSVAAGAVLLAAPVAAAVAVAAAPSHSAVAQRSNESTPPSTITLTTRRTGSVIL